MCFGNKQVRITKGLPVVLDAGFLEVGDAGKPCLGIAAATVLGTSASAKCAVYCDPDALYFNDADDVLAYAKVGSAFQITSTIKHTTKIDASTASDTYTGGNHTAYQFVLLKVDPDSQNDMSNGLFKIHTPQLFHL